MRSLNVPLYYAMCKDDDNDDDDNLHVPRVDTYPDAKLIHVMTTVIKGERWMSFSNVPMQPMACICIHRSRTNKEKVHITPHQQHNPIGSQVHFPYSIGRFESL